MRVSVLLLLPLLGCARPIETQALLYRIECPSVTGKPNTICLAGYAVLDVDQNPGPVLMGPLGGVETEQAQAEVRKGR